MAEVTAAVDTFSDAAICGSEGNRILVASVPVAASAASTAICAKVEETSGSGAVSIVTVWSAMEAPGAIWHDMYHIKWGDTHDLDQRIGRAGVRKKGETVIARSKATKQSSFLCGCGLLRGACHRARVRATRWLAMTRD